MRGGNLLERITSFQIKFSARLKICFTIPTNSKHRVVYTYLMKSCPTELIHHVKLRITITDTNNARESTTVEEKSKSKAHEGELWRRNLLIERPWRRNYGRPPTTSEEHGCAGSIRLCGAGPDFGTSQCFEECHKLVEGIEGSYRTVQTKGQCQGFMAVGSVIWRQ